MVACKIGNLLAFLAIQSLLSSEGLAAPFQVECCCVQEKRATQQLNPNLSISAATTGMATCTVQAGLGVDSSSPRMHRKRERAHTVTRATTATTTTTTTTSATTTVKNYRTRSPYKSRWRQQLCEPKPESKVQIWIEIPAPSSLVNKMAFAEQQRWITVQQKTFTKWLNTKLEARSLEVKDLVQDLSDGVCFVVVSLPLLPESEGSRVANVYPPLLGHPHPPARVPVQRVARPICRQTEAARAALRECQPRPQLHQVPRYPDDQHWCRRRGGREPQDHFGVDMDAHSPLHHQRH